LLDWLPAAGAVEWAGDPLLVGSIEPVLPSRGFGTDATFSTDAAYTVATTVMGTAWDMLDPAGRETNDKLDQALGPLPDPLKGMDVLSQGQIPEPAVEPELGSLNWIKKELAPAGDWEKSDEDFFGDPFPEGYSVNRKFGAPEHMAEFVDLSTTVLSILLPEAAILKASRSTEAIGGLGDAALRRSASRAGGLSDLASPMTKAHVKAIAERGGVGLKGVELRIVRDPELVGSGVCGEATTKRITLYPDAFWDDEQLLRTIGHERTHVAQIDLYGEPIMWTQEEWDLYEEAAYGSEQAFVDFFN